MVIVDYLGNVNHIFVHIFNVAYIYGEFNAFAIFQFIQNNTDFIGMFMIKIFIYILISIQLFHILD